MSAKPAIPARPLIPARPPDLCPPCDIPSLHTQLTTASLFIGSYAYILKNVRIYNPRSTTWGDDRCVVREAQWTEQRRFLMAQLSVHRDQALTGKIIKLLNVILGTVDCHHDYTFHHKCAKKPGLMG
jgi:hypothetical protein